MHIDTSPITHRRKRLGIGGVAAYVWAATHDGFIDIDKFAEAHAVPWSLAKAAVQRLEATGLVQDGRLTVPTTGKPGLIENKFDPHSPEPPTNDPQDFNTEVERLSDCIDEMLPQRSAIAPAFPTHSTTAGNQEDLKHHDNAYVSLCTPQNRNSLESNEKPDISPGKSAQPPSEANGTPSASGDRLFDDDAPAPKVRLRKKRAKPKEYKQITPLIDGKDREILIAELCASYQRLTGKTSESPFDGHAARILTAALQEHKTFTLDDWRQCIANREASEDIDHGAIPKHFIKSLGTYIAGPKDRFHHTKRGANGEARVHPRTQRNREAAAQAVEWYRQQRAGGGQ